MVRDLDLDERATHRVVSALVDAGYLERHGDRILVAPDVRPLLDPAGDANVGDRLLHIHHLIARWTQLPGVLRDGGPARFDRTPETLRAFIGSMRTGARDRAEPLADLLAGLFPTTKTVLDIGGGPATQALAFHRHGWKVTRARLPGGHRAQGRRAGGIRHRRHRGRRDRGRLRSRLRSRVLRQPLPLDVGAGVRIGGAGRRRCPVSGGALCIYDFLRGDGLRSSFAVEHARGDQRRRCVRGGGHPETGVRRRDCGASPRRRSGAGSVPFLTAVKP